MQFQVAPHLELCHIKGITKISVETSHSFLLRRSTYSQKNKDLSVIIVYGQKGAIVYMKDRIKLCLKHPVKQGRIYKNRCKDILLKAKPLPNMTSLIRHLTTIQQHTPFILTYSPHYNTVAYTLYTHIFTLLQYSSIHPLYSHIHLTTIQQNTPFILTYSSHYNTVAQDLFCLIPYANTYLFLSKPKQ